MTLAFDLEQPRRNFTLRLSSVFKDRITGIYGPSGAGKSSFFNILAGLEKPRSGRIIMNGRTLTDTEKGIYVPVHKRRIGLVFQERLLFPHLTIHKNILFGCRYRKKVLVAFDEVVDLLDLKSLLEAYPTDISGGEQQRAAIARALLASPELLLMDEPFNAIDTSLRRSILPYIHRLSSCLKIPLLVISHDLSDLQQITGNFFLIDKGISPASGSVEDIRHNTLCRELFPAVDVVNSAAE